jgi:peptidoglycan hydrolase-like protein with peptidoglycan-binding domain
MCVGLPAAPATIAASSCPAVPPFLVTMAPGAEGTEVRHLQEVLLCLGYFPKDVVMNGYYGVNTTAAVIALQNAHGIPPRGMAGSRTRAVLNGTTR